jgi:hypothetical protein
MDKEVIHELATKPFSYMPSYLLKQIENLKNYPQKKGCSMPRAIVLP